MQSSAPPPTMHPLKAPPCAGLSTFTGAVRRVFRPPGVEVCAPDVDGFTVMAMDAATVDHAGVLDAADLALWRAFRAARSADGVSGSRAGALGVLARSDARSAAELNVELVRIKSLLVDAGVVPRTVFMLQRSPSGRWRVTPTVSGSRAYRDTLAAGERVEVFDSARFATNALVARSLVDVLDAAACVEVADALRAAAQDVPMPPDAPGYVLAEVAGVGVGTFWSGSERARVGVRHSSFGTHIMTAAHAVWVGEQLCAPVVASEVPNV